jgi:hypothetical protein
MHVKDTDASERAPAYVDAAPRGRAAPDEGPTGSGGSAGGSGLTRVTVNLNRQAVQALEAVSDATGYSKTDTINRALQVYAIVHQIMERSGGVLHVKHEDGELERIHIV